MRPSSAAIAASLALLVACDDGASPPAAFDADEDDDSVGIGGGKSDNFDEDSYRSGCGDPVRTGSYALHGQIVTPHLAKPTLARASTPGDHFVPPSDFELFVFGAQRATPVFANAEDRALMGLDPTKGGLEGGYGHVLH